TFPIYFQVLVIALTLTVILMSIKPVKNMISPGQRMNASFNPLHLVNSYGAFGSVTRTRYELIIEGTTNETVDDQTEWKAYEFKGKPGHPGRTPPQIAPYHLRLDWQLWFAAMTSIQTNPWLIRLIKKLLKNDEDTLGLLRDNPFIPFAPEFIRIRLFKYEFTSRIEQKQTGNQWKRSFQGIYLSPKSLDDF
ncbi:MAG TPA: lipase maturation factor family protein, partial [Balneolaceae bacterium]